MKKWGARRERFVGGSGILLTCPEVGWLIWTPTNTHSPLPPPRPPSPPHRPRRLGTKLIDQGVGVRVAGRLLQAGAILGVPGRGPQLGLEGSLGVRSEWFPTSHWGRTVSSRGRFGEQGARPLGLPGPRGVYGPKLRRKGPSS